MSGSAATAGSGSITLRYIELCKFRRLGKVQLDLDKQTTILVGANNSGKTSILVALRHFLSESSAFGPFDISLSQWPQLRALGKKWDDLKEDPSTTGGSGCVLRAAASSGIRVVTASPPARPAPTFWASLPRQVERHGSTVTAKARKCRRPLP